MAQELDISDTLRALISATLAGRIVNVTKATKKGAKNENALGTNPNLGTWSGLCGRAFAH
jgi:hypothetical protein